MSKNYIGDSNNVAKKISKWYVSRGGVARRAIKGYIGVDGIATPIFSCQNQIVYVGTATNLSIARRGLATTTIENYALFGGGNKGDGASGVSSTVDTYDNNLVKGTVEDLSVARYNLAATTVGNYVLFGGGLVGNGYSSAVYKYDKNLVHQGIFADLSVARSSLAATTVGNYALFGGGGNDKYYHSTVDVIEAKLI